MKETKNKTIRSYLDWSDQGAAGFWRYAIGFVLTLAVFFVISGFGIIPLTILRPDYQSSLILSVVGKLMGFIISFLTIPLLVKLLHKRPSWSVALPEWKFKAWDFWTAFWVSIVVGLIFALFFSLIGALPIEKNPDFKLMNWLLLVFVGFAGLFIQTGAEELVFRGYFTQMVRRFTSNKFFFIGIPVLLFALPHISNLSGQVSGGILLALPYIIAAVLFAWAAYRSGSLWMALGLHLANNYSGLVLVGTKGDALPSAAPFQILMPSNLAILILAVAVQTLAIYFVLNYMLKRREAGQ